MNSRKTIVRSCFILVTVLVAYSCIDPGIQTVADFNEWFSGGSQTAFVTGSGAFENQFNSLSPDLSTMHGVGDGAFNSTFVSAPALIHPGLGPVFNNVACSSCHIADGRGRPPINNEQLTSILIRLSIPGTDAHGGPVAVPGFGTQLQSRANFGTTAEAFLRLQYTEQAFQFPDGEDYSLRTPQYTFENPYIPLPGDLLFSPRVAPPVFGLGLLEAIPESDILAQADEMDLNGDGISGKPNYVWNLVTHTKTLGRFGWKANNPSILQQTAGAYSEDMGITNFIFPQESSYGQVQYDNLEDEFEVSDSLLHAVAFYIKTLAVPARRNADKAIVLQGKAVFTDAGCGACHKPMQRTAVNVAFPAISNQVIFPYTDLLLHNMGPDLADNRPDFDADGFEWRTPPLWGIGLTQIVNGHSNFLHDGRARSFMEAILWHGGEAEQSKEYVKQLPKADRDALVKFLESL